jgi:2-methylisocitrate lyase-like PEP mutase family enzyme
MSVQAAKAETFRSLHVSGRPVVLFNIWDAGTAKAVASAGARALATGSWSVAAANGFADGERIPLDLAIDNLARLVEASPLPVNIMVETNTPSLSRLAELGVARVSHGPGPYLAMMKALSDAARAALLGRCEPAPLLDRADEVIG